MIGYAPNVGSTRVADCTPQLFDQAIDGTRVAELCHRIAQARDERNRGIITPEQFDELKGQLKRSLPVITPHATFQNGRRNSANATPTGLCMYDKDHVDDPAAYWQHVSERLQTRGLMPYIALAHITPSGEGLRLVFVAPRDLSLEEAQRWMAAELDDGDDYDPSVKDLARCSFLVCREYVLHLNEQLLFATPDSLPRLDLFTRTLAPATDAPATPSAAATAAPSADSSAVDASLPTHYKGVPYALIVDTWLHDTGGPLQMGERNNRLFKLAVHLRNICDSNFRLICSLMPPCGLPDVEIEQLVRNAIKISGYNIPREMLNVLDKAAQLCGIDLDTSSPESAPDPSDYIACARPPEMPERLPALIDLLVSRTPQPYRPAVAHAVFPSLAAHLRGVTFRYIDNVDHEATLMNVLMAGTGAGKSCITEPINHIMADIRQRDAENLRIEREWKEETNAKGANQERRRRPQGLVIQEIDPDITNPAFILRTAESDGHFLYAQMNEIEQFDALRGATRGTSMQFQIMCLAFDPGNRFGQTRASSQAISEKVTIRFNWNASTTIVQGQRYFSRQLINGPITRLNFCTIPEREIGAPMPVYGTYDVDFDVQLRPYIERLCRAAGPVSCPQATALAHTLADECADYARLSQSRTFENFSFRALVIAYLKACVLYVAAGEVWTDEMDDFVRWSLRYDLWCKMHFFGEAVETEQQRNGELARSARRPGPCNLLALLPETFTRNDAALLRTDRNLDAKGTSRMLCNWVSRGYIRDEGNGTFTRVKRDRPKA